ncbi:MAG: type 4a pilus biogenesis protein PilO [Chromatiales bacterium]|nr:type 4a pilus biogenesis protein PilO [Chromatiales bacterium]
MPEALITPDSIRSLGRWLRARRGPLLFFAVLIAGFFGHLQDLLLQQDRLQRESDHLTSELAAKQAKAVQVDDYKKQRLEFLETAGPTLRLLPDRPALDELLRALINAAIVSGIELRQFSPQTTRAFEFYQEQPVSVSLTGRFDQLGRFAEALNGSPLLSRWRFAEVEPAKSSNRLSIRGEIAIYAYFEPETEPARKGKNR